MNEETLPNNPLPTPIPTPKKKSNTGKIIGFGCGGLVALLLLAGIIITALTPKEMKDAKRKADSIERVADAVEEKRQEEKERQEEAEAATKKAAAKEAAAKKAAATPSIGVSRRDVEQVFSWMNFEKRNPVDGAENYIATAENGAIIQLIGPADALSSASFTGVYGGAGRESDATTAQVVAFVRIFDSDAGPWLGATIARLLSEAGGGSDRVRVGGHTFAVHVGAIGEVTTITIGVKP